MQTFEHEKSDEKKQGFELRVSYLVEHKAVKIMVSGALTFDTYQQLVPTAIAACKEYATHLILIDQRAMTLEMGILDVYELPQRNLLMGATGELRVAIIYAMNETNKKRYALYEDRAVTSDMTHHVFSDEKAALDWLISGA